MHTSVGSIYKCFCALLVVCNDALSVTDWLIQPLRSGISRLHRNQLPCPLLRPWSFCFPIICCWIVAHNSYSCLHSMHTLQTIYIFFLFYLHSLFWYLCSCHWKACQSLKFKICSMFVLVWVFGKINELHVLNAKYCSLHHFPWFIMYR